MSDPFMDDLRRNWREQDAEIEGVAARLKRGRRLQRLMLWLETAMGVLGPVFGIVAAVLGVQRHSAFLTVGGVSLVLSAPLFAWLAWRARKGEPDLAEDTPEGVLGQMIARTHTTERLMRLCRWQGWALVALTALLWAVSPSGFIDTDHHLAAITVLFLGSAAWAFGWAIWRERGARRERTRCRELLAEYR
jgi:hypothetical protein